MSSLFSSEQKYDLCEPCFFDEEAETEEVGTNNIPERLAQYETNIKLGVLNAR